MGCMLSHLASKFAFFPPSPPTYQIRKRDGDSDGDARLTVVPKAAGAPVDDSLLDVLMIDTKRGNKIVGFYLRNPCARLTLLYSHGNAADLGQLYDLFLQLKVNLRVNLMGFVLLSLSLSLSLYIYIYIYILFYSVLVHGALFLWKLFCLWLLVRDAQMCS